MDSSNPENSNETLSEGTIQFAFDLAPAHGPVLTGQPFAELAAWRSMLLDLALLGQTPERYDGYGYGNISIRDPDLADQMIITASQTSGERHFTAAHLTRLTHVNFERFWVEAQGEQPPSSEALTHAALYASDARIRAVLHVHDPVIWRAAERLRLPTTGADVGYGTREMFQAVHALTEAHQSRPLVITTAGHEDGVFACGANLSDAGTALLRTLARARAQEYET